MKNTIRIYGLGGAGINIVSPFVAFPVKEEPGLANIEVSLLDTSHSNLPDGVSEEKYKIIASEDTSGSGGLLKRNFEPLSKGIPKFLMEHKPEKFNILVSSASGGSGCISNVLLAQELAKRNIPFVSIIVVDDESHLALENSLKTITNLDSRSRAVNAPFPVMFFNNSDGGLSKSDRLARESITHLRRLFSNEHFGLDNEDLTNFLRYTNVYNTLPVGVVNLSIKPFDYYINNDFSTNGLISATLLHQDTASQEHARGIVNVPFVREGITKSATPFNIYGEEASTLVYSISANEFTELHKKLKAKDAANKEAAQASISTTSLTMDGVNDDGFAL